MKNNVIYNLILLTIYLTFMATNLINDLGQATKGGIITTRDTVIGIMVMLILPVYLGYKIGRNEE